MKQQVTRKDILEFSGQPSDELQQSGQIIIQTSATKDNRGSIGYNSRRPKTQEAGSDNGSRTRPQPPRDNSIIERNKAKLAEFAEKKL